MCDVDAEREKLYTSERVRNARESDVVEVMVKMIWTWKYRHGNIADEIRELQLRTRRCLSVKETWEGDVKEKEQ